MKSTQWIDQYFHALEKEYDKKKAYEYVYRIFENDRFFDFIHFNKTADNVAVYLEEAGLKQIEKLPLAADGLTRHGDWLIPRAWDVRKAELRIVSPEVDDPVICDYAETPCSLYMLSANTPRNGITAEVVDIDKFSDPSLLDLSGKIVFTRRSHVEIFKVVYKKRAIGIISDYYPIYPGIRDTVEEMGPHSLWDNEIFASINKTGMFAFCLSPDNGKRLRELIRQTGQNGTVILNALVDTVDYEGVNHTVSGVIPGDGTTDEEFILCAHLYEPGANDNASGCGAAIELAACINRLIEKGTIPRPRRNIRIVLGYEGPGYAGYALAHREQVSRTVAALHLDMIGEVRPKGRYIAIEHDPLSNYSCTGYLLSEIAKKWGVLNNIPITVDDHPFAGVHLIFPDPMFGVPTATLMVSPARNYHSSMDNMTQIDADVLKQNAVIAGVLTLLCTDNCNEAVNAAAEIIVSSREYHDKYTDDAKGYLLWYKDKFIRHSFKRIFGEHPEFRETEKIQPNFYPAVGDMTERIPKRLVPGTLTLSGIYGPGEKIPFRPIFNYKLNCPIFWIDGKRTIGEIAVLTAAELGIDEIDLYVDELVKYFTILYDLKYIA